MESFQQGETVEILTYSYTYSDVLINQTTLTVTINQPDGTEVLAATVMTNDSTGVYSYNYTLEDDADIGVWTVKIIATSGTEYTIQNDLFKVTTAI